MIELTNLKKRLTDNPTLVFLILIAFTLAMRAMTLPSWILDSDEITYAVMADHWLNGSVLYRDIIDIKPPGIFMIFALIQIVFGKSMLAIRLITIGVVAGSAYFLYRTKRQIGFSFESALISSIAFILMFNFYFGFASNAEVFFIFTTSLGVHIFFRARSSIDYFLTGIIFGIGFCIKQLILFDLAALGLFFFMTSLKSGDLEQKVVPMALIVLGFLIPFGLAHLTFWAAGHFDGYYFVTYVAPGNYMSERTWQDTVTFLSKGILVYLPFILLAICGLKGSEWPDQIRLLPILLFTLSLLAISIPGKSHQHYYLQMAYPVSFALGEIASLQLSKRLFNKQWVLKSLSLVTLIYCIFLFHFYYKRYIVRPNPTEALAKYVEQIIPKDATLYAGDAHQFLYWHLNKVSPTPYVHSSLLLRDHHIATLEVDVKNELSRIYDTRPDFIVLSEDYRYVWFKEKVIHNYEVVGEQGHFVIYEKRKPLVAD